MKPVFIMSSERSGSNLLREMLGAHSNFSAPPAAQLPRLLCSNLHYYGDLRDDKNLRTMAEHAIRIVGTHPVGWDLDFEIDFVLESISDRSAWGVIAALYQLQAARQEKHCWVSKDNFIFEYALAIRDTLPKAKYLYLVRDGRDYACSMRRVHMAHGHIFDIARVWRDEQRKCVQVLLTLNEAVHLVRYEELISTPKLTLSAICDFLEEPFELSMMDYHRRDSSRAMAAQSDFWKNLRRPVMRSNFGKFISELTSSETTLFESVAGPELTLLGYPRFTDVPVGQPSLAKQLWYRIQNWWTVYWRQKRVTETAWRRRRRRVIEDIRSELVADPSPLFDLAVLEYPIGQ